MLFVPLRQNIQNLPVFGARKNEVVLLAAGVSLELVDRNRFGEFLWRRVEGVKITHGGHAGSVVTAADLLRGNDLFKGLNHCAHQPAGNPIITGQEAVLLKKASAAGAAVAAFAKDEKGSPAEGNVFDDLLAVVVCTAGLTPTGRANVHFPGQFDLDEKLI